MFHVVDDNVLLCELAVIILDSSGYEVAAYSDPVAYLQQVKEKTFIPSSAIITDIRMPVMDGNELIARVRKKFPKQKFLVVSGFIEEYENAKELVCHGLSKPYSPSQLLLIAEALLKCEKTGPASALEQCLEFVAEERREHFKCPLDCVACN